MLRISELSQEIADYKNARISLDDFEDWFRTNSRGAYRSDNDVSSRATVAIESALSRFHFQGITEDLLREELADAIRPFEEQCEIPSQYVPQQNRAANNSDCPMPFPVSGNNSNTGFNVAGFNVAA